jgi:hypothetical protein
MRKNGEQSPAGKVMDEAIELAIAEEFPYSERATFVNAGTAYIERHVAQSLAMGMAVVLCSPDGSVEVIEPDAATD